MKLLAAAFAVLMFVAGSLHPQDVAKHGDIDGDGTLPIVEVSPVVALDGAWVFQWDADGDGVLPAVTVVVYQELAWVALPGGFVSMPIGMLPGAGDPVMLTGHVCWLDNSNPANPHIVSYEFHISAGNLVTSVQQLHQMEAALMGLGLVLVQC